MSNYLQPPTAASVATPALRTDGHSRPKQPKQPKPKPSNLSKSSTQPNDKDWVVVKAPQSQTGSSDFEYVQAPALTHEYLEYVKKTDPDAYDALKAKMILGLWVASR